jgi:hypothetical protein
MPSTTAEAPSSRILGSIVQPGEPSGTEPITEQELGYWIRASSRRPTAGPPSPIQFVREQFPWPSDRPVRARRAASTFLLLVHSERAPKAFQKSYHQLMAMGLTQLPDSGMSESIVTDPGNQASTISANVEKLLVASLGLLPGVENKGWRTLYVKLESFSQLEDGWNSYSAPRPTNVAITNAREFLDVLCTADMRPNRITPSAVGGIGVTFRVGERKSYVEFLNAGRAYVLFSDGIGEPEISEISGGYQDYVQLIGDIRKYLNA